MTEEERNLLHRAAKQVEENGAMTRELYKWLLEVPPGSPSDERPLLESIRIVVRAYNRGSWMVRAAVWLLPTMVAVGVAAQQLAKWLPRWNG